jgi:starch-binding outer membrane protein, SusD/RagB family
MKSIRTLKALFRSRLAAFGGFALLGAATLAGGLYSCSPSFLNVPPQGEQTPEDFFSGNPDAAASVVNAVYNKMLDWNMHSFGWNGVSSITSDDADKGSDPGDTGSDKDQLDDYTFTSSSASFNDVWEGNYEGIARANRALDVLPKLTVDAALKSRLTGEAQFLRAFFYFKLVRIFGGVPLVNKVPDVTNPADLESARVRASREQIYQLIETDLTAAIANMPERSAYPASELGRVTKGSAKTMLAKVAMYQRKWADVLRLTDEVIASGEYSLVPDYATIWREEGRNSRESIFEVQARGIVPNKGIQGYVVSQSVRGQWGWGFNTPTESLEKSYETGDPRRAATIIYGGETLWDGEKVNMNPPNPRYSEKAYLSRTKESFNGNDWESNKTMRVLRYAEVLLMNAEAANELGMTAKAVQNLNQVRERARKSGGNTTTGILPDVAAGSQAEVRAAIWRERRVELAFEHDRTFDLIRQGRAADVMKAHGKNFVTGKHELFPIPQRQIELSGGKLTQNPGY